MCSRGVVKENKLYFPETKHENIPNNSGETPNIFKSFILDLRQIKQYIKMWHVKWKLNTLPEHHFSIYSTYK